MEGSAADIFHQLEWSFIILGMIAVLGGAVTQGITGLGFGMVSAPFLLLINPMFVPGPMLLLAGAISFMVVLREGKQIDLKALSVAIGGRIPGTILAALTFSLIPLALYGVIFGILVLIAVILTGTKLKILPSNLNLSIAGFVSGFMGTLTSVGAPPMALAYQHGKPEVMRPTLAAFFLIGSLLSLLALFFFGNFTTEHIYVTAFFIPVLYIGFRISIFIVPLIDQRIMRRIMLIISGTSSIILIIRSVMTLYA